MTKKQIAKLEKAKLAKLSPSKRALQLLKENAVTIIKARLKKKGNQLGELSRAVDLSEEIVLQILDEITADTGLPIDLVNGMVKINHKRSTQKIKPLKLSNLYKRKIRVGIVSDTHLCGRAQQPTMLHTAYADFDNQDVDFILHAGDLSDGSSKMHVGMEQEILHHSYDSQIDYISNIYPHSSKGIKTYIRRGNHDESWIKGGSGDLVAQVCRRRDDLIYLPPESPSIYDKSGDIMFEMYHPSGGSPYAKSYRGQKILEATLGKVLSSWRQDHSLNLPHVLLVGHLHLFNYFIDAGCHVLLVPCLQRQTNYLRSKSLTPVLGYIILDFLLDKTGKITGVDLKVRDLSAQIIEKDY